MITTIYHSPLGDISLAATARGLAGLWFRGVDCVPSKCADSARFDMNGGGLIDPDPAATVEGIEGCDALSGARPMCAWSPVGTWEMCDLGPRLRALRISGRFCSPFSS